MTDISRNVLILCPSFFGYENRIANAFREAEFDVSLYDERPSTGFIGKTALRLNLKFYKPIVNKHIRKIINENSDKQFKYVLVVKGEAIGKNEISLLREAYPNAKMLLYCWDSIDNVPDGEKKLNLYDKVVTFDPNDAQKYNIPFLPIPYGYDYIQTQDECKYEYDVAFIGTAHSVRPRVVKQIREQCEKMGRKCFTYFYSPHILVFLLNKLINKDFRYISLKETNFKPLSTTELCRIYNVSRCVLDIEHTKQHGTTTRPVELLPMKKKIITTNPHVKDFDFYCENNFFIINRNEPIINESFFESEYMPIEENVISRYSPKSFVENFLDNQIS